MDDERDDIQRRSTGASGGADGRTDLWRDEHLTAETLAEFRDGPEGFGPDDRAAIEAHLAGCAACREVLADMQTLVSALKVLPEPPLRRSFALTPEMLGGRDLPSPPGSERQPIDMRRTSAWRARQIAAVRYAAAAAAVLFVLVLGADVLSNTTGTRGGDDDAAAMPETMQQSYATDAPPADDPQHNSATPASGAAPEEPLATTASAAEPTATSAAASAGGEADATPADTESALSAQATEDTGDKALTSVAPDDGADRDQAESAGSSRSGWRTLEFGLVLLLAWLLAALVILPRVAPHRASRE